MVKESTRDGSAKKKRKTANSEGETVVDLYKKSIEFEEKEALSRRGDVDAQIYFDTCQQIRQIFDEIRELKENDKSDAKSKIAELTTEVCMRLVLLKKLNRMEKVRLVFPKEQLNIEKQKVDSINLHYQNLLYEANHLKSEHRKCFQFKSKDENIELVPVEEFLREAPETLTNKFKKDKSNDAANHELRLARLEWELQQRIHLAEMCKQLEEEKKKLELDITERRSKLDKLGPLLSTVMEATKPVQEHLELYIDKIQAEHKLAALLPSPLYLFYANADAYRQVNDKRMKVVILGDKDEAVQWKDAQQQSRAAAEEEDEESAEEREQESQESEDNPPAKKRRHHKSVPEVNPVEEKRKKLLEVHPLAVEAAINIRDGPSIRIKLSYHTKLEIVTVTSSVDAPGNITGNAAKEVLSNESILVELSEGDLGTDSPNPCTPYQLQKVGLGSFRSLVSDLGHVYNWAQQVCGVDFLAKAGAPKQNPDRLSQTTVERVMRVVKRRLRSRYALAKQLQDLEKNIIPSNSEAAETQRSSVASLTKFATSTYQDFCQSKLVESFLEAEFVSANDLFYVATLTRASATLKAFIAIKNDYPSTAPMFALSLDYDDSTRTSQNDDNIRDLERAVNVEWNPECASADWLLSTQMASLCVGLDIYLETEDPKTFSQNTMYIKSCCARNRRKPFKFRNIGVGVYTQ